MIKSGTGGELHPTRTFRTALRGALGRLRAGVVDESLSLIGIVLASIAFLALYRGGSMADIEATLELMGYDPDRASLIGALAAGATGAAIVGLVGGRFRVGVLVGRVRESLADSSTSRPSVDPRETHQGRPSPSRSNRLRVMRTTRWS